MRLAELECPRCYTIAQINEYNRVCACGHEFQIEDPAFFRTTADRVEEELAKYREAPREAHLSEATLTLLVDSVLVTTEQHLPDLHVTSRIGVITSEYVGGINIFRDVLTGLTDTFGGRSQTLENELKKMRQICLEDLKREAVRVGAK